MFVVSSYISFHMVLFFRMIPHRVAGLGVFYSVHIPAVETGHIVRLGERHWGPAILVGLCVAMEHLRGVGIEGRNEKLDIGVVLDRFVSWSL